MALTPSPPHAPPPLFRAGRLSIKLVALTVFAVVCAIAAVWAGVNVAQTWGIERVDGGVLKPLWARLAFGGTVAALGVAFGGGMLLYWRYYIISIDLQDGERTVVIGRLFPYPTLRLPVEDVSVGTRVRGAFQLGRMSAYVRTSTVNAPWLTVRLRGWRIPMVLDLKGVGSGRGFAAQPGAGV